MRWTLPGQTLPQHTLYRLHLLSLGRPFPSSPLPQHTLYRLHQGNFGQLTQTMIFASAHSIQVASERLVIDEAEAALPQHTLYRLHRQKYTVQLLTNYKMCCESVDSFSADHKWFTALTIFPCSFTTKATYVAISGSIGRTIDRFCRCELCYHILIAMGSRNTHA